MQPLNRLRRASSPSQDSQRLKPLNRQELAAYKLAILVGAASKRVNIYHSFKGTDNDNTSYHTLFRQIQDKGWMDIAENGTVTRLHIRE